ncbi:DUF421 domain-containing protein [Brevibacillus centrosporus]|uniref:DUF421 domain-containing protein n=1 Tax=Brevibacillus centrosporus TaxID=54910 RepID=UPI000F0A4882|nr:DUF421 domain-containing protein [Brevibacillus centrosporus]MEC2131832.1 DUF421 domain-containing protein [Brevibacillus centrosporus]MED4909245.1 DUF421 domain-containing protein [Brevibacillus centrosporus]RNB69476.1 DUF421 domain-containing protein [Brevibacillus centrosporus]GED33322.1 hypothetical protein BCE02nite_44630 [Brevibacillus centrosporus]
MPDWLNIALRSIGALVYLFLLTKLIGKRQIRQLTYIEYIVGITIGSIAAFMATEMDGPIFHSLISLTIFAVFPALSEWLSLKSKWYRDMMEGKSTIVIQDGKILENNLAKEKLTAEDLLGQLRVKNVFRVADVEFALMETSGELTVQLKTEQLPVTPSQLKLNVAPAKPPQTVIMDGKIMPIPLAALGKDQIWLETQLKKRNKTLQDVFLGQVDESGNLYLDFVSDAGGSKKKPQIQETYETLKQCLQDLEQQANAEQNSKLQAKYKDNAAKLEEILKQIQPQYKH